MTEMDFSDVLLRLPGLFCVVRQASCFLQKTSGFEDIKSGNVDDLPFDFMGKKACIAKAMEMGSGRLDGKLGNIVYDKNRVQE